MNKIELDFKNTMALVVFFYLTMSLADALFVSKYLKRSGRFLGLKTGAWGGLHASAGTIFSILTLAHLAYRKDKVKFIKEYLKMKAATKMH